MASHNHHTIMNRIIVALTVSAVCAPLLSAEPVPLNAHLKALDILGSWHAETIGITGDKETWKVHNTADLDGHVIRMRREVLDAEGNLTYTQTSDWRWEPETRSITSTGYDSLGGSFTDRLVRQSGNRTIWFGHGYDGEGKKTSSLMEFERTDADTMTLKLTHWIMGGEVYPDWPKVTLTRIRTSPEEAVREACARWDNAYVQRDPEALRRVVGDDYVGIDWEGNVFSKADEIEITRSGKLVIDSVVDLAPRQIRVYGDTAVLIYYGQLKQQWDGKDDSGTVRSTSVWVKRDGQWQVVSWHGVKLAP